MWYQWKGEKIYVGSLRSQALIKKILDRGNIVCKRYSRAGCGLGISWERGGDWDGRDAGIKCMYVLEDELRKEGELGPRSMVSSCEVRDLQ